MNLLIDEGKDDHDQKENSQEKSAPESSEGPKSIEWVAETVVNRV